MPHKSGMGGGGGWHKASVSDCLPGGGGDRGAITVSKGRRWGRTGMREVRGGLHDTGGHWGQLILYLGLVPYAPL